MKNFFKTKFLAVFLCLLLVFTCVGCEFGSYTDSNGKPNGGGSKPGGDPSTPVQPVDPDNPDIGGNDPDTEKHYTVNVLVDSALHIFEDSSIQVEWVNKRNNKKRFLASLNEKGFADAGEIEEAEYYVHLLNLPVQYSYNPNGYVATPSERKIFINLKYPLKPSTGSGTGWRNGECYQISVLGTYRAQMRSSGQEVHYCFSPTESGWYSISSWVDIFTDEVRPVLSTYIGNKGGWVSPTPSEVITSGGEEGTYTKNFVYNVFVEPKYVGNTYYFTVQGEHKFGTYPVSIDFTIKYEGEVKDTLTYQTIRAAYAPRTKSVNSTLPYHYADAVSGGKTFDASRFKYNFKTQCYHVYDRDLYKVNDPNNKYAAYGDGFGPRLYCDITKTTPCFNYTSLYNANNIVPPPPASPQNWLKLNASYVGVPYDEKKYDEDYENSTLNRIFEKYTEESLYWDFTEFVRTDYYEKANNDGRVYVTKELKIFLQLYAEARWFWSDNMFDTGIFDYTTPEGQGYFATQDSFWLFACGYYD